VSFRSSRCASAILPLFDTLRYRLRHFRLLQFHCSSTVDSTCHCFCKLNASLMAKTSACIWYILILAQLRLLHDHPWPPLFRCCCCGMLPSLRRINQGRQQDVARQEGRQAKRQVMGKKAKGEDHYHRSWWSRLPAATSTNGHAGWAVWLLFAPHFASHALDFPSVYTILR
jgi:hypothetical protein